MSDETSRPDLQTFIQRFRSVVLELSCACRSTTSILIIKQRARGKRTKAHRVNNSESRDDSSKRSSAGVIVARWMGDSSNTRVHTSSEVVFDDIHTYTRRSTRSLAILAIWRICRNDDTWRCCTCHVDRFRRSPSGFPAQARFIHIVHLFPCPVHPSRFQSRTRPIVLCLHSLFHPPLDRLCPFVFVHIHPHPCPWFEIINRIFCPTYVFQAICPRRNSGGMSTDNGRVEKQGRRDGTEL